MTAARWTAALILGLAGAGGVAAAEPDPREVAPPPRPRPREIVIEIPGERSLANKLALAGVAGAGLLAGAAGLSFHLDARSAAQDVEAARFTGRAWTEARAELVDRAERSSARAAIGYGVGGALVAGAAVAYILTAPRSETSVIRTTDLTPAVAPVRGGAVLGGTWRF